MPWNFESKWEGQGCDSLILIQSSCVRGFALLLQCCIVHWEIDSSTQHAVRYRKTGKDGLHVICHSPAVMNAKSDKSSSKVGHTFYAASHPSQ